MWILGLKGSMLFATVKPCSYNHPRFMKGFKIFGLSCLGNIVIPSTDGTSHTDKYKNIHWAGQQPMCDQSRERNSQKLH